MEDKSSPSKVAPLEAPVPTPEKTSSPPPSELNSVGPEGSAVQQQQPDGSGSRWARTRQALLHPHLKLYTSRFLSSFGDRLWTFALGLVLVQVGGNLQLPAISGFLDDCSVLLLGPIVGRWVDRSNRLKAARVSLAVNNFSVCVSALCLYAALTVDPSSEWYRLRWLLTSFAIVCCSIGVVASSASKIVVTKDWTVCVAEGDNAKLATVNAWMVRIDQFSMTVSPIFAGQIMASASLSVGCIFVAAWNLISVVLEYWLLTAVHKSVPAISRAKSNKSLRKQYDNNAIDESTPLLDSLHDKYAREVDRLTHFDQVSSTSTTAELPASQLSVIDTPQSNDDDETLPWHRRLLATVQNVGHAFKSYYGQYTFPAALGLAIIYLTVLGLDSLTSGYAYQSGVAENYVGLMRAVGALFGFAGSFAYPLLRHHIGLPWTGWTSLFYQTVCNVLAVVSVFLPGSVFDPVGYFDPVASANTTLNVNSTQIIADGEITASGSHLSIWVFMIAIALARLGVWMADLSISQSMQECAEEHERGTIFGVQSAMQSAFNLLKNLLVIVLPDVRTFGLLIIVSWVSVAVALASYTVYLVKALRNPAIQHKL